MDTLATVAAATTTEAPAEQFIRINSFSGTINGVLSKRRKTLRDYYKPRDEYMRRYRASIKNGTRTVKPNKRTINKVEEKQ